MRGTRPLSMGCIVLTCVAFSCRKGITADMIENAPDAIAQRGPLGTSTWIVRPDGAVKIGRAHV